MDPATTASSDGSWSASAARSASSGTEGSIGLTFAERPEVETAYLGWLGPTLAQVRVARSRSSAGVQVGTPPGTRYTFEGAIATALGPRDDTWLETAIADPRVAIDITPWWADATDSRYLLNRALALMWLQVRWRKPAIDGEAELLDEVHRLLSQGLSDRARPDVPVACLGRGRRLHGHPRTRWRARSTPRDRSSNRRRPRSATDAIPCRITHEGWVLEVPGEFAERRTAEEWWGGGAGRSVTLRARTDTGSMAAQAFLEPVRGRPRAGRAQPPRRATVVGRARLTTDASSGVEVGVLDGYSAIRGSGAAIRIEFDDPADWQWALDLWRSLAPG